MYLYVNTRHSVCFSMIITTDVIFDCIIPNVPFGERYILLKQVVPETHDYILEN